jgi:hypothetical protein
MSALIFYMHDGPNTFRFELSGNLAGAEVGKLDQAWRTASSTFGDKVIAVDITYLTGADQEGRALLGRWAGAGAHLIANSEVSQSLVESITGIPYSSSNRSVGPTFEPRFTSSAFRAVLVAMILAIAMLFPARAFGAELKPETLAAWDQYVVAANLRLKDHEQGRFLWVDESPERLQHVRAGEVVVSPIHAPQSVPGGLIHHWVGAAFIPGARVEDVISVVRNYDRYTEFYKPSIVDARTLSRQPAEDRFSVVVVDKAMFMKRALDSEYRSRFIQVDGTKWYSVAQTTRVQEMSEDHRLPDGEGSGYIWRLCTISRYEERDHGVYIETEAMALSRPIPATLHWMVDPIVRRVSRTTLTTSLEQTRDATGSQLKMESALSASRRGKVKREATNE